MAEIACKMGQFVRGAFLKTPRHKNIGHKDTNLCLFNTTIRARVGTKNSRPVGFLL
jgi:hypothetical protein